MLVKSFCVAAAMAVIVWAFDVQMASAQSGAMQPGNFLEVPCPLFRPSIVVLNGRRRAKSFSRATTRAFGDRSSAATRFCSGA